jgi:hypothetical protein
MRRVAFPGMDALDTILRTGAAYQAEFRPILDEYCIALDLEGCFDGLSASEANQAAVDIVVAVCRRDDPADYLHQRADEMVASALAISRSAHLSFVKSSGPIRLHEFWPRRAGGGGGGSVPGSGVTSDVSVAM